MFIIWSLPGILALKYLWLEMSYSVLFISLINLKAILFTPATLSNNLVVLQLQIAIGTMTAINKQCGPKAWCDVTTLLSNSNPGSSGCCSNPKSHKMINGKWRDSLISNNRVWGIPGRPDAGCMQVGTKGCCATVQMLQASEDQRRKVYWACKHRNNNST